MSSHSGRGQHWPILPEANWASKRTDKNSLFHAGLALPAVLGAGGGGAQERASHPGQCLRYAAPQVSARGQHRWRRHPGACLHVVGQGRKAEQPPGTWLRPAPSPPRPGPPAPHSGQFQLFYRQDENRAVNQNLGQAT